MERALAFAGALLGLTAVALGAFAAHGLAERLEPRMLEVFKTGAHYQMMHALAIFAALFVAGRFAPGPALAAAWCFVGGSLVFSGSLYLLALTGVRWLGAITPIGGVAFIVGWALLAWSVLRGGA